MKNKEIEIPLSKIKLWLGMIGSLLFVVIAIWMLITDASVSRYNPLIVKIAAFVGVLFFGACLIFMIKKLFDKEMGLIINEDGIYDNSSGVSAGLIDWKDINEIRVEQIMTTKFILIFVNDPEKYLERIKSKMKARIMRTNMKMYGTPISISSNALKYKFKDLANLIEDSFKKYK